MEDFPAEVLATIFDYLPGYDVVRLMRVSKRFNAVLKEYVDDLFWKRRCLREVELDIVIELLQGMGYSCMEKVLSESEDVWSKVYKRWYSSQYTFVAWQSETLEMDTDTLRIVDLKTSGDFAIFIDEQSYMNMVLVESLCGEFLRVVAKPKIPRLITSDARINLVNTSIPGGIEKVCKHRDTSGKLNHDLAIILCGDRSAHYLIADLLGDDILFTTEVRHPCYELVSSSVFENRILWTSSGHLIVHTFVCKDTPNSETGTNNRTISTQVDYSVSTRGDILDAKLYSLNEILLLTPFGVFRQVYSQRNSAYNPTILISFSNTNAVYFAHQHFLLSPSRVFYRDNEPAAWNLHIQKIYKEDSQIKN